MTRVAYNAMQDPVCVIYLPMLVTGKGIYFLEGTSVSLIFIKITSDVYE